MTTADAVKTAAPAKIIFHGRIPLDKIDVKAQVRKKFDENAHKELTESVRTKDVINPVTLRPKGDRYELVAGERRFRAAKAAGLPTIPATVRDLDDQSAALYQVEENIHRKDLTPIEEARGFKLLTQPVGTSEPKYTVEQLAQLVDKSTAFVYRALALLELPKEALDAIESGTLTPAHGHQLMRVPAFDREELLKEVTHGGYDGRIMPANELRDHINDHLGSDLAGAKFPKDKPYAGMSACNGCPSNTANQSALFDEAVKGTCTNNQCFMTKTKQIKKDFFDKTQVAHLGAAFVEYAKGWCAAGTSRTGGWVIKEELTTKNAKGLYGVMICSDQKLWLALQPKGKKPADNQPADQSPNFDWERENTGKRAAYKAEIAAILVALKAKELTQEARALALDHLLESRDVTQDMVVTAWRDPQSKAPLKITPEMFRKLVFVDAVKKFDGVKPADVKFLNIDLKKIRAAAKKKAIEDYDAAKKAVEMTSKKAA